MNSPDATNRVSRRDCLQAGIGLAAAVAVGGCAPVANRLADHPEPLPLPTGDIHPIVRVLSRATFGPRPGDVARASLEGVEGTVDRLLRADEPEELRLKLQLARLDVLRADPMELLDIPKGRVIQQLQQAAILQAIYGRNQLHERMVDLWTNHFNVYSRKEDAAFRKGAEETRIIRQHALGRFADLLDGTAHSPAMLAYLDNHLNKDGHANENYARELMELHTLGVDGGYSQRDVQEVARCFTGWTIENRYLRPRGRFRFDPDVHDDGEKTVLGHTIPAKGGIEDGKRVLAILETHPATAHHIGRKIVRHFLGHDDAKWIDRTAATFERTNGDIREMLRPILVSRDLVDGPPLLRRPLDYMVAAVRALDIDTDAGPAFQDHLAKMGELLYEWPMPDGYPTKVNSWTGNMLPRWNFAHAIAAGTIAGTSRTSADGDAFEATHHRHASDADKGLRDALRGRSGTEAIALCLAAPTFQWT